MADSSKVCDESSLTIQVSGAQSADTKSSCSSSATKEMMNSTASKDKEAMKADKKGSDESTPASKASGNQSTDTKSSGSRDATKKTVAATAAIDIKTLDEKELKKQSIVEARKVREWASLQLDIIATQLPSHDGKKMKFSAHLIKVGFYNSSLKDAGGFGSKRDALEGLHKKLVAISTKAS